MADPAQQAADREHRYRFFSRLYLNGLSEETLPAVRDIGVLSEALPETYNPDEAAADHYQLFGFNVFPHQSIFLDPSGLLGGESSTQVYTRYREAGFVAEGALENAAGPDHIGHELAFMAHLCRAENHGLKDGRAAAVNRAIQEQQRFLDDHILWWLPPLALATFRQGQTFYSTLARLTLDFVLAHRRSYGRHNRTGSIANEEASTRRLPPAPDLMADEATGLKEIAAYLVTPVYSGIYLSRDEIGRLARQETLPRGFGGRRDMLHNLLRSAAAYDGLENLLARLEEEAAGWKSEYEHYLAGEVFSPYRYAWVERVEGTIALIREMDRGMKKYN